MSAATPTGGPAFPVYPRHDGNAYREIGDALGMSLRDYFAAKAMQAEIITSTSDATPESAQALIEAAERAGLDPMDHLARNAYRWADAMLKAREA